MTRRKELPWCECHEWLANDIPPEDWFAPGHGEGNVQNGRFVPEPHCEMFSELVRRVLDKDDFTEFAKKCQKEIFEG